MNLLFKTKIPGTTEIAVDGRIVSVTVRRHARAKSYRLSIPHSGGPVLTLPPQGRWPEAQDFLRRHVHWLAARLPRAAQPIAFAAGSVIPLRGVEHLIAASGKVRGQIETVMDATGLILVVPGDPQHQQRRLTDWLKHQANADLAARCAIHARTLGVTVKAIKLRDQASRWGSCSSTGNLNFNWRLVLAPAFVLDYVAAHEVAHLVQMNHSPAFWATVEQALPDMAQGRAWLKAHGRALMAYGV